MHVLLTNDDGPISDKSCPYMKYFVDEIKRSTDWDVSIVIPNQQRSWIGKAHFAGQTLTTTYIYTKVSTDEYNESINSYEGPYNTKQDRGQEYQEWCLLNSTPAACADIGIHHLYTKTKQKPIDLVISGPNFGKNSSNLYILASGTVGAAMEAVTHGVKAIALSYAFSNLDHDFKILREAAKISVKTVQKLYTQLKESDEIDLFTVNIPLVESLQLGRTKLQYAPIMMNSWESIYASSEKTGEGGAELFEWRPDFKKVYKDGLADPTHTDSRVLLNEEISVTPLKAAFNVVEPLKGEISLSDFADNSTTKPKKEEVLNALITIPEDSYLFQPLSQSFTKAGFQITKNKSILDTIGTGTSGPKVFHYGEYEDLDFDKSRQYEESYYINSNIYRKGLIRKHYLASTIKYYLAKNPRSSLAKAFPDTYTLELDYAEFLDDALDDAYELRDEINEGKNKWILKPSMSDKGQGIRIFRTVDDLQQIFNSFEESTVDENGNELEDSKNGVIISQLRHFIVQEYIDQPLLLRNYSNRKFHLRVYVLCSQNLSVYVYKNVLALFAATEYKQKGDQDDLADLSSHLTNTCLQESQNPLVEAFWDLKDDALPQYRKTYLFEQICDITAELFKAATTVDKVNFQPMPNSFEIMGLDFLVADDSSVSLLEVNAYPDFKQTGDNLKSLIHNLFDGYARIVGSEMSSSPSHSTIPTLVKVLGH